MRDIDFRSIHVDLEKGIFKINGRNIQDLPITELNLTFDGTWKLSFKQEYLGANKKTHTEDAVEPLSENTDWIDRSAKRICTEIEGVDMETNAKLKEGYHLIVRSPIGDVMVNKIYPLDSIMGVTKYTYPEDADGWCHADMIFSNLCDAEKK